VRLAEAVRPRDSRTSNQQPATSNACGARE